MAAKYTGHLDLQADGTIAWKLTDFCGWQITGTATKDPAGGYTMTGVLGDIPEALRIPIIDDSPAETPLALPVRVPFGR
jgi:hypothetical protein